MKHWSWAYVLCVLNNEAANITFDELFNESIQSSCGDATTRVFSCVLQNKSLQAELSNFLKELAQKCVAKGDALQLHKVKNLKLIISSCVMENLELKVDFESFMSGGYESMLKAHTTPDSSGDPPHLTAYLTILLHDSSVSERPSGCPGGPIDDLSPCRAASISKVQLWLSQPDRTSSSSLVMEQNGQRLPNRGGTAFKQQTNAIFKHTSSSESDSEHLSHQKLPLEDLWLNTPPVQTRSSASRSTELHADTPTSELSSERGATSLGDNSFDSWSVEGLFERKCHDASDTPERLSDCPGGPSQLLGICREPHAMNKSQTGEIWSSQSAETDQEAMCHTLVVNSTNQSSESGNNTTSDSCQCTSAPQNLQQQHDPRGKLITPLTNNYLSVKLYPPTATLGTGEQLVSSVEQASGITKDYEQSSNSLPVFSKETELPPDIQIIEHLEAASNSTSNGATIFSPPHVQLWNTQVKNSSNLASLKTFILSLPVEMLDPTEGNTLCHALVGLNGQGFSPTEVTHLLELLGENILQHCMVCQDSSGNTPLHCAIEAKMASTDVMKFLLRFTTHESVLISNNDSLTPLELSFEKKLWSIARMLIECQIKTEASCAAELLQEYIFKTMRSEGGADFLPQLLDLREQYCPHLDLNFSNSSSSRTPWWHLANSHDVSTMSRILQTLRNHSIDFSSLQTRTEHGTKLVEEAEDRNELLFRMIKTFTGQQQCEEYQDTPGIEVSSVSGFSEALSCSASSSSLSKFDHTSDQEMCAAKNKQVQLWLSEYHQTSDNRQVESTRWRSSGVESGTHCMPNKGKSERITAPIFRNMSSSESDSEQVGHHGFNNPMHSFPTVAGTSEAHFDTLPSRNAIQEECVGGGLLPGEPSNIHPPLAGPLTPLQSSEMSEDTGSCESSSEDDMTSLEADDSSDGELLPKSLKCPTKRLHSSTVVNLIASLAGCEYYQTSDNRQVEATKWRSSGVESGTQSIPNKRKSEQITAPIFRNMSSSESDSEQVGHHGFNNPMHSFPTVAGTSEAHFDTLPSRNAIQEECVGGGLLPGEPSSIHPPLAGPLTPLQSSEMSEDTGSCESSSEDDMTSLEADDSSDGELLPKSLKCPTKRLHSSTVVNLIASLTGCEYYQTSDNRRVEATKWRSSGVESGTHSIPNKRKSERITAPIFRNMSSSESDSEQVGHHGFNNPMHSFPTVAGTSEAHFDTLPSRNAIQEECVGGGLLPGEPSNIHPPLAGPLTPLQSSEMSEDTGSCESSSEDDMTSLEADDSSDGELLPKSLKCPTKRLHSSTVVNLIASLTGCEYYQTSDNRRVEATKWRSSGVESGTHSIPNKRKSERITAPIFRNMSSSESDSEQVGHHGFNNPMHSFPTVAGTSEAHFDTLPSRNAIQEECVGGGLLPGEPSNIHPPLAGPLTPLQSSEMSEDTGSCESSSEDDVTSLEADDSSDGGSGVLLPKASKYRRLHSTVVNLNKAIPVVKQCCRVRKKNSLVVYQRSGYSGDDSDHTNDCSQTKSSKFTSARRAAGMKLKEQLNKESSSEYSDTETEDYPAQVWNKDITVVNGMDQNLFCHAIKLTLQGTSCALQISNSTNFLSLSSNPDSRMSTELHHAVKHQCLQSVRDILACDGGEDQIQMMDEEGHTPLQIASQNEDLNLFELLLESLICSQASPSVTLPPCYGRHKMALLASIVKIFSKKEIDIDDGTFHWIMMSCQLWKIPRVVYATPTTVLTMGLLQSELLLSTCNQMCMYRGEGSKKKKTRAQEVAVQEQGAPSPSEMVSGVDSISAHMPDVSSLVTGLAPAHKQPNKPPIFINLASLPATEAECEGLYQKCSFKLFPELSDLHTLPRIPEDTSSHSKSSSVEPVTPETVSQSSSTFCLLLSADSEATAWQAWINKAVDCLHAGYYSQMLEVLKFGKVPPSFPPEIAMAAQFGCALAYYKLEKYSEAAKHLESLKTTAASAQSCGNESIASVYLGDIDFTQSRYTEAAKHYSHALKLYRSDSLGKEYRLTVPTFSAISAKLGTAFRNTSKVVDAVQAYRKAIATADSKKDKLSAHTSLGNLFQSVGENASALAEYEHSIKLSEELQDYVSLGWAHGNMGNAYLGLYQRDKGLYHLEKALDLTLEYEPTPQAIGRAYNNLGTAYQALNELDKAEEKYDLALSQAIRGNDLPGQARVYGNIGNVLMLRKDYDRAVPHYTEVLRLSRDRPTVSTAFHNRGCSYYEWGESKKATLLQKAALSLHGPDFENCEVEHQPSFKSLPNSILKYYQLGRQDLEQVIKYHEETFENIKGSSKGLTLSVSLFETNSRTFHRLQDCLVNLGEWEKALVVAEQSRTRTLGELLVKRKNSKIDHPLTAPLNLQSITDIVQSQHSVVVYLSYTGARLLGWVLAPTPDKVSVDMFEVPLEDDQFDRKSFDYHLRYSLTEELVEKSFEMYRAIDYKSDVSEPVRKLYKLVCKPLMRILKELKNPESSCGVQEIIIIPDSYTCRLPFPCLLNEEDKFLGDNYSFRIMPSLLTMGIVDQLPSVVVQVPADGRSMCVVGNPTIPSFVYNGDQWSLGKLPFATREAEWVASILKTTPILHEQATKDAVLMRTMNAKVIHIATHGSASAGFLAFAGMSFARNGETVEAKNVLLYPEDIEQLSISPALVVLSSCDSGRGTVKADGILGMARAFILAGAQAVLTTLWRVPDESASVFMRFFYQYLMDGLKASLALQKATLSVRSFSKYSQYIHWSGYQLTGQF